MIRNFINTALRNILKQKGYNFLNIFGMAIGLAAAAMIFLWIEDEITWNHYFPNRENIYLVKNNHTYDGITFTFNETPGPLAPAIENELPGVAHAARVTHLTASLFSIGDKKIYNTGYYADESLFQIFKLKFIYGSALNAFDTHESLIISAKMAKQFFGTDNPIGKIILVDNNQNFIVKAVFEDLPSNGSITPNTSTFKVDWLAPFALFENRNKWLKSWANSGILTYISLNPKTEQDAINKQLHKFISSKAPLVQDSPFIFEMDKWHLYDKFSNGKQVGGKIQYVRLFSMIAIIILLIACINFMNLSTARSEKRAKEVGIRKVAGARKELLILQFISESLVMALIAGVVALCLISITLPYFNKIVEKELLIDFFKPAHMIFFFAIIVICGFLAGSYPAFYLSAFNPINVFKKLRPHTGTGAVTIRKVLVVSQFSISVILIVCTIFVYQQIRFAKTRELGYAKDQLVYLSLRGSMKDNFYTIRNDLIASGTVDNATLSKSRVLQMSTNTGDLTWDAKDPEKQVMITIEDVGPEYISTTGLSIKEGRDFHSNSKADSNNIIINETLAGILDKKQVLGTRIREDSVAFTVIGVIKDHIYNNMYSAPVPMILFCNSSNSAYLIIRLRSGVNTITALSDISRIISHHTPGYPVDVKFVDEEFERFFKSEILVGRLSTVFSVLAIIISCLGLFGLAAYTAEQRVKEIGIRKVLGASIQTIVVLLTKDFLQLVLISCLISLPIAWWYIYHWLENFEYRINIQLWVFAVSSVLALLIASLTVGVQAAKAAVSNPVKNLRSE